MLRLTGLTLSAIAAVFSASLALTAPAAAQGWSRETGGFYPPQRREAMPPMMHPVPPRYGHEPRYGDRVYPRRWHHARRLPPDYRGPGWNRPRYYYGER